HVTIESENNTTETLILFDDNNNNKSSSFEILSVFEYKNIACKQRRKNITDKENNSIYSQNTNSSLTKSSEIDTIPENENIRDRYNYNDMNISVNHTKLIEESEIKNSSDIDVIMKSHNNTNNITNEDNVFCHESKENIKIIEQTSDIETVDTSS